MKLIKSNTLYDGIAERKNLFIGFENDEITFVGSNKPKDEAEVIADGQHICVTPAFIDTHELNEGTITITLGIANARKHYWCEHIECTRLKIVANTPQGLSAALVAGV